VKSKYLKTETIPDKTSLTVANAFKRFQARMERRMNLKIQNVQCDDGNEYKGAFLEHIESEGIIKRKSDPYLHHFPGPAENANNHILYSAKGKLKASKLPLKFYSDAILDSSYLHNRIIHTGDIITPYEHVYDRKPKLDHLVPFGCIGYSIVSIEKRTHPGYLGKLDDNRVKCRRIGYADDDDTEELKGYKILVEGKDLFIDYSTDVIWNIEEEITPVVETDSSDSFDSDFDKIVDDSNYTPMVEIDSDTESVYEDALGYLALDEDDYNVENYLHIPLKFSSENLTFFASQDKLTGLTPEMYMLAFVAMTDGVPMNYKEAMESVEKEKWQAAMDLEITKIKAAKLENLPKNTEIKNIVKNRWVFKKKLDLKGNVKEYKARLVAKGFTQKFGVDFHETFAPVAKLKSIRLLTAIAANQSLDLYQDDVPSAFLKNPVWVKTVATTMECCYVFIPYQRRI
jgi:hypothetical protein